MARMHLPELVLIKLLKGIYYLSGGVFGVHLIDNFSDQALFIDYKGFSGHAHVLFAVHILFNPYAISLNNFFIRISDQGKRQIIFCDKFLMRSFIIGAYPQNFKALFQQRLVIIPETAGFGSTAGSIIFWIKVQDHIPA